ncbi:MAG: hypothetical protein ACI9MR_003401 [Myxococcota bacterium]|jgi:hypothetical protein
MGKHIKTELDAALAEHERRFEALYGEHLRASAESESIRAELWLSGLVQPRSSRRRTLTLPNLS